MNMQKRESLLKAAHFGLVIVMLCSLFAAFPAHPVKADSTQIFVGLSCGDCYHTLSAAVKNANPNTIIYVYAGDYYDEINLAQMGVFEGGQGNLAIISVDGPGAARLHGNTGNNKPAIHDNNQPFYGSLWIDGMTIDSGVSSAISMTNFTGLMLTNVTIANAGDPGAGAELTDAISLRATTGSHTVALSNTNVYDFVRDGLDVQVSGSAKVNVVVENSAFKALTYPYTDKAQKGVDVNAVGTAAAQLTIYKTVFDSLLNAAISATADSDTPVTLTTHVFNNTINNVAKGTNSNALEIRARKAGAHTVNSWFYTNSIYLSNRNDGIELEPAAPGTFNSVLRINTIETVAGPVTPMARGIVIDNGASAYAATTGNFKLEGNNVKNAVSSGLDVHMTTKSPATWNGLISNNTFDTVNKETPADYEGVHFKVHNNGGMPTYNMVFTGNKLLQAPSGFNIKLENVSLGTFRVVSTLSSSAQEIKMQNATMNPYITGNVPTIRYFSGLTVDNSRPITVPDVLVTWSDQVRPANVVENDIDTQGRYLVYVNSLGEKGGSFWLDTMETPETQLDDLMVYQAQAGFLDEDKAYYVMQDTLGCLSIGYVTTKIGAPLFLPQAVR